MLDEMSYKILLAVREAQNIDEFKLREVAKELDDRLTYTFTLDYLLKEKCLIAGQTQVDGKPLSAYHISPQGNRLLDEHIHFMQSQENEAAHAKRAEIRGWITTVLAILAFIISVISLTWQISKWKQETELLRESQSTAVATTAVDDSASN